MLYSALRPLLFRLDAEAAHHFALSALRSVHRLKLLPAAREIPCEPMRLMGLTFPNPVGLAAGLDKNGQCIDALASLGFGFIEVGTVTPRPQPGNPKPRLFRVPQAEAIINRMGFNNLGVDQLIEKVTKAKYRGVLGINIGKNFDTPIDRAADDYLLCLNKVYPHASYVTVNISSPNTKNLRQLQGADELDQLLKVLRETQLGLEQRYGKYVPMLLKIAPDLEKSQIEAIADLLLRHRIDGVIATNTTLSRVGVATYPHGNESGGMSGKPLYEASTAIVEQLRSLLGDDFPIVGVGGIGSGAQARGKIKAGAQLVQIYSGLIYHGPRLVTECRRALCPPPR